MSTHTLVAPSISAEGSRWRAAREAAGLTATRAPEAIGYKQPSVSSVEIGTGAPSRRFREAFAKLVGVQASWLETGEGGTAPVSDRKGDHIAELTGLVKEFESVHFRLQEAEDFAADRGLACAARAISSLGLLVGAMVPLMHLCREQLHEDLAAEAARQGLRETSKRLQATAQHDFQTPSEAPPTWIPVHQVIPDEEIEVLCVDPEDGVVVGFRQSGQWWRLYGSPFHPTHWRDPKDLPLPTAEEARP